MFLEFLDILTGILSVITAVVCLILGAFGLAVVFGGFAVLCFEAA